MQELDVSKPMTLRGWKSRPNVKFLTDFAGRYITSDKKASKARAFLVTYWEGEQDVVTRLENGRYYSDKEHDHDVINLPEEN